MQPLRIGIVGLGGICRTRHVPGFRRIPGVEITAVANRSRASGEQAANEFGIPHVYESWEELIDQSDVDVVVIGTWPYLHREISVAALAAGKHVFCQARMAMDAAEARRILEEARRSGRVAALCPVPIGLRYDRTVNRLLRQGYLGELRLVRVQSLSDVYADPDTSMNWRKDHRLSGLNMLTLGMYIEVMHRWFGWTRGVQAMSHIFVPERTDETGARVRVEIPDQLLVNTELETGFPVQYVFSAMVLHGGESVEIYGSEGTLRYDVDADRLFGARAGSALAPVEVLPEELYNLEQWRVEEDFVAAVREGAEYHPDFQDGLRYMEVIQAVYDSVADCRTVFIEPVETRFEVPWTP